MSNTEDYIYIGSKEKYQHIPKSFIKQLDTTNAQENTQ